MNGKFMRMALILKLLAAAENKKHVRLANGIHGKYRCENPKCISAAEITLEKLFTLTNDGIPKCVYCETKASPDFSK